MTADTVDDPRKTTTYRVMLGVVIILGILIIAALGALVIGGIMKFSGHKAVAGGIAPATLASELPPGARIMSIETNTNRVVIAVHSAQGDEVDIFDTDTGRPVARIRAAPPGVLK